jgi:hypothetical protein
MHEADKLTTTHELIVFISHPYRPSQPVVAFCEGVLHSLQFGLKHLNCVKMRKEI